MQLFSEIIFFNSTTHTKYLFNVKLFIAKNNEINIKKMVWLIKYIIKCNTNSAIFKLYHGKKLIFNEMTMRSTLYYTNTLSWILQCQLTETTVRRQTYRLTWKHYPDSEPTCLCSFSLLLYALRRSNKYQYYCLWCDPIRARPHNYRTRDEYANLTPSMRLSI